ncbi:MAG: hypothetical protein HC898_06080 [Phycisphaerales bacterium]|nr:hypothetical protein [Phycisphaerales bacterium]
MIQQFRQLQCQSGLSTYGQLLVCGQPPVMLLDLARQRFKAQARQDGSLLPVEVARLLYYVVVAAGVMRIGRWFSQLSDTELRSAVLWALDRPWLQDELLRQVLQEAQAHLDRLIGSQSNNLPSVGALIYPLYPPGEGRDEGVAIF